MRRMVVTDTDIEACIEIWTYIDTDIEAYMDIYTPRRHIHSNPNKLLFCI